MESLRRKVFDSPRPPPKEGQDALSEVLCFADVDAFQRKAPWLPSLCWNHDALRDAASLVSGEEGAQAFFVLFAYQSSQTAMFLPLRRFQLALLALTRVSGEEALNAWENHEFMFEYYQGTWIGDDEISFGKNHHIQVLAGLTFLSNEVMTTDEQPKALHEFLERRGITQDGRQQQDTYSYEG